MNIKFGGDKGGFSGYSVVVFRKVVGGVVFYRVVGRGVGVGFGS